MNDDPLCFFIRGKFGLFHDVLDGRHGFSLGLRLQGFDKLAFGLINTQSTDLFQLFDLALVQLGQFFFFTLKDLQLVLQIGLERVVLLLLLLGLLDLLGQLRFLLFDAILSRSDVFILFADGFLVFGLKLNESFLGLENLVLLDDFRFQFGFLDDRLGL